MKNVYREILKTVGESSDYKDAAIKSISDIVKVDAGMELFSKYEYSFDKVEEAQLMRLEFTSEDAFFTTGYMDENLLYYCIITFLSAFKTNPAGMALFVASDLEYILEPAKALVRGVDILCLTVMGSTDGEGNSGKEI